GDRRKLDRFFAAAGDLVARVRTNHGLAEGDTIQSIEAGFCAELAREIEDLCATRAWLAEGAKSDMEAAEKLAPVLADIAGGFAALGDALLTGKGEPRARLATKNLADARPDLMAYLTGLQTRYCAAAERRRAARAAQLVHAALLLIRAMRAHYQA